MPSFTLNNTTTINTVIVNDDNKSTMSTLIMQQQQQQQQQQIIITNIDDSTRNIKRKNNDKTNDYMELANFFEHGSIITSYNNSSNNDNKSTVDTVNTTSTINDDDNDSDSSNYDDMWSISSGGNSLSTFDSLFEEDDDEFATHHSSFNTCSYHVIKEEEGTQPKRKVRFSTVTIREYGVTVGAVTSINDACPLTLSWEHAPKDITIKLSCCSSPYFYNDDMTTKSLLSYNNNERNTKWVPPKRLSIEERRERIARVQGLTCQQVRHLEYETTIYMLHDSMSNFLSSFKTGDRLFAATTTTTTTTRSQNGKKNNINKDKSRSLVVPYKNHNIISNNIDNKKKEILDYHLPTIIQ